MKKIVTALSLILITVLPLFSQTPELGYMAFVSMRDGHEQIYVMSEDASIQTRITNLTGYAFCSPKISPDGSQIAAVGYKQANEGRGGNADIYVMDIDGLNLKRITEGGYDNECPEWMPGGSRILFASKKSGKWALYTVDKSGKDLRQLTGGDFDDFNPALSPDGKTIAFESNKAEENKPRVYSENESEESGEYEEWDEYSVPDGVKVEYVNSGSSQIYVMDIEGKNRKRLTNHGEKMTKPFWHPDGSKLYYFEWYDRNMQAMKMNPDGTGKEQTGLLMENGYDGPVAWVIGGRIPVFSVWDKEGRRRNLHGLNKNLEPVSPVFITASDNYDACALPLSAPDKKLFTRKTAERYEKEGMITFSTRRDGEGVDVYVMTPDGSLQRKLTSDNSSIGASLSYDRKKIYYVGDAPGRVDAVNQIYVMNADGTEKKQLTFEPMYHNHVDVSPDGEKLLVISGEEGKTNDIYVMNKDGSGKLKLTEDEYYESDPKWSPDGKRIVFSRHKDKRNRVFVMDADGKNQKQISNTGDNDDTPCWSPDGALILFESECVLMTVRPDGTELKEIKCPVKAEEPCYSPEGKKIAFKKYSSEEIYVVNADGSSPVDITNSWTVSYDPCWR